jgi:hypothetical protein
MATKHTARQIALESILSKASQESFDGLTESEWTQIVNLAWDSQSVIDAEGRREHREQLKQILEGAVVRNSRSQS